MDHRRYAFRGGQISHDTVSLVTKRLKLHRPLENALTCPGEHHLTALGGQGPGGGKTDSGGAAGTSDQGTGSRERFTGCTHGQSLAPQREGNANGHKDSPKDMVEALAKASQQRLYFCRTSGHTQLEENFDAHKRCRHHSKLAKQR